MLLVVYTSPLALAADDGSGNGAVSPTAIVPPDIEIGGRSRYHYFDVTISNCYNEMDTAGAYKYFHPFETTVEEVYAVIEGTLRHPGAWNTPNAALQVGFCWYGYDGSAGDPVEYQFVSGYDILSDYHVYLAMDITNPAYLERYCVFLRNCMQGQPISGNLTVFGLYNSAS